MTFQNAFKDELDKVAKEQKAHIQSIKHLRPIGGSPTPGATLASLGAKLKKRETTANFK